MKLQNSDIIRLRSNVEKQMGSLRQEMDKYRHLENSMIDFRDRLSGFGVTFSFVKPDISDLTALEKWAQKYREAENDRFRLVREIDNIAAIIAGSLTVAIEACMENYSISLKQWIGRKISDMADLREKENEFIRLTDFSFPSATAILTPYLYKTKTYSYPQKFALVRNAIRDLIY